MDETAEACRITEDELETWNVVRFLNKLAYLKDKGLDQLHRKEQEIKNGFR